MLRGISNEIYNSIGVQILRGFPVQKYNKTDQIIAFLGINAWVGDRRLNQGADRAICHIKMPDRDADYPPLSFEEREAFAGWQWVADEYSLKTDLEVGDIEWVNNLHLQHARRGFTEDITNPRHLIRIWLSDSENSPELPEDIKRKFDAMFAEDPNFFPLDEIDEDLRRRQSGIFTGSCKQETADERLQSGGIEALNSRVVR
ncbi:hypothetical protein CBS470a_011668 [Colletotrichum nupharicola]|nr:hypothetical protein CBS470a_011668 [Colletotrichum nupharicola]